MAAVNAAHRIERRDWLAAAMLFVAGLMLYTSFRSQMVYHWDGAEFVLAVKEYSVALSQPHAPGYFLYVMAGRLVNAVVGDAHRSLLWLGAASGSGLVVLVYLLGLTMFGRRAGVAAALITLTSPQVWFHSCVALTYIVDAFCIALMVWCCWRAIAKGGTWGDVVLMAVVAAVDGGVRPQSLPGLLPLALYAAWHFRPPRLWKAVVGLLLSISLVALWFVPMVEISGGWPAYLEMVRINRTATVHYTWVGGGWPSLERNLILAGVFSWNGLGLAAVVLVARLLVRPFRGSHDAKTNETGNDRLARWVVAFWAIPMIAMGIVGVTHQPGYVLSYLPALLLITGAVVARRPAVMILVVAANVMAFLAWPNARAWDAAFFGAGRSAPEIRAHDERMERLVETIRGRYPIDKTTICFGEWSALYALRHFQIYLPEFEQCQLLPDPNMKTPLNKPLIGVREGRLIYTSKEEALARPVLLLVVPRTRTVGIFAPYLDLTGVTPVAETEGMLYELKGKGAP